MKSLNIVLALLFLPCFSMGLLKTYCSQPALALGHWKLGWAWGYLVSILQMEELIGSFLLAGSSRLLGARIYVPVGAVIVFVITLTLVYNRGKKIDG